MGEQEMLKMTDALQAIEDMLTRSMKMQDKFKVGSPQHTLLVNRINALRIASSILSSEISKDDIFSFYTKHDLQSASTPLLSIISKSEKAILKVKRDSWQFKMLTDNLQALEIVMAKLREISDQPEAAEFDSM